MMCAKSTANNAENNDWRRTAIDANCKDKYWRDASRTCGDNTIDLDDFDDASATKLL
jgi:hypothetical protein